MKKQYTWVTIPQDYNNGDEELVRPTDKDCYLEEVNFEPVYIFDLYDTIEEAEQAYIESDIKQSLVLITIYSKEK